MNFTQSEVAGLYSQGNAHGASPLGLVVALYDTILRDLRRAGDAIAQGDVEKRTFELNHALRVIAELENVLDFERGSDAAPKLKNFYVVMRGMILDASIKNSREALHQLWEIFATVRKAWNEAERKMKNAGDLGNPVSPAAPAALSVAPPLLNIPPANQPAVAQREPFSAADVPSRGNWSA